MSSINEELEKDGNALKIGSEVEAEKPGAALEPTTTTRTEDIVYPSGFKVAAIMSSIFSCMFLVALDRLIIATAIPRITDQFHSVDDIGWYASAYQLTTCAFQLVFGKIYKFFSIKWTFLISVFLFEVGSAICGAAPSSTVLIVGRAISGIGGSGMLTGILTIFTYAVPLQKRPMYQGMFGAVFGVASIVGPPLGGALTDNVSWRWCFYINLPFGGVTILLIALLLHIPDRDETKVPIREKLSQLDLAGTSVFMPGTVCLLLALQWGGQQYPWSDGRIIALIVLAGVLILGFIAVQILMPRTATVPPRIFVQRSIMAGAWTTFCIGAHIVVFVYYLPIYFQAIQGVSAVESGVRILPLVLSMVVASITAGVGTTRLGYYTPFMIVGSCIMIVGAGLLTTLSVNEPQAKWVGYQFLYGFGLGMTFQSPTVAAQTVLPRADTSIGVSIMMFFQLLGGAIFVCVGQTIMNTKLISNLSHVSGFDADVIVNSGATSITDLPAKVKSIVIPAYNNALHWVFIMGLILACLTILGSVSMEWRSVKKNKQEKTADGEEGAAEKQASKDDHTDNSQ